MTQRSKHSRACALPRTSCQTVVGLMLLMSACRPGMLDGEASASGASESCVQLEIAGLCFRTIELNMAGGVELASDLNLDGDMELILGRDGSLLLLDVDPEDSEVSVSPTDHKAGWMVAANLTETPNLEVVSSSAAHSVTSVLELTQGELSSLTSMDTVLGPLGAIEMAPSGAETWIAHALPTFTLSSLAGDTWSAHEQALGAVPGCGINDSAIEGDYDGDGRQDAAFMTALGPCDAQVDPDAPTPLVVLWSSDEGVVEQATRVTGPTLDHGSAGDVNGDGVSDLLAWRAGSSTAVLLLGGEDPLSQRMELEFDSGRFIGLADFDGDGVDAVILWRDSDVLAWTNLEDPSSPVALFRSDEHNLLFADVNGDNIDDFIQRSSSELVLTISSEN